MIYECDQCSAALPAGAMNCPKCGEKFDDPVPSEQGFIGPASVPVAPVLPGQVALTKNTSSTKSTKPPGFNSNIPVPVLWLIGGSFLVFILILVSQSPNRTTASAGGQTAPPLPARKLPIHVMTPQPSHSAPTLNADQRNGGFVDIAYARAYDRFGRAIMRRDSDVKEVAESSRDSASGFYVMLRRSRLPASRAAARAQRYLTAFVSMRGRYFSPEEAAKADMTLRASDETTMASADQDGSKPDCIFYDTCKQQDAAEAASPPTLDTAIARLQEKCGPDVTPDDLRRVTDKAHDLLAARGIEEDPASIASHVADTIPAGYQPGKGVTDLFAAYVTLRVDGGQ